MLWQAIRRGAGGERKAPACVAARQLRRRGILAGGLTRRLRRGWWAAAPRGAVLSFEAKESTKESTRHGDSRGGPPRFALFANIGVPGTAVPGSCICSGLPVANCLRQLCPLGTRSLSAQASACGSPSGCPRPRLAALTRREKALYCPFLKEGVRNVARNGVGQLSPALGARSCSLFSSFKKGKAFSLRCLSPLCSPAVGSRGRLTPCGVGCFNVAWKFLQHKRPAGFQIHAGLFSEP